MHCRWLGDPRIPPSEALKQLLEELLSQRHFLDLATVLKLGPEHESGREWG